MLFQTNSCGGRGNLDIRSGIRSGVVVVALVFSLAFSLAACGGSSGGSSGGGGVSGDRTLQGGDTTSDDRTTLAFENPASNLSAEELDLHLEGDFNFGSKFVSAPAPVNPGLGPVFNNNSCEGCHTKNGRGQPVFGTGPRGSQAVVRVSGSGAEEFPGGPRAVGNLGTQLQDHAIFGVSSEATINLSFQSVLGRYGDGTGYELRRPALGISLSGGGSLPGGSLTSVRLPPPIFGLGLLEAVSDGTIQALADPDDANGDGISGRVNMVWDVVSGSQRVGRFGRKATRPTLIMQAATAYANDIGISNPLLPGGSGNEEHEVTQRILETVAFYTQTLAVPRAAATNSATVQRGLNLFRENRCSVCHVEQLQTGDHPIAPVANQTIFAYTDLLLHDMGPGLADNRPDYQASGTEWRTSPLWGIGVTATILSSTATYLHDGRARSLEEAILWHGGEAEFSREAFRNASEEDRTALIEFLKSL